MRALEDHRSFERDQNRTAPTQTSDYLLRFEEDPIDAS